jgi:two-component system, OmpR family, alkaline phosphatase synthesis response regulator PhoP
MKKARILVVDDEEDILELIRYNLDKEGFDVLCAENGEKCLALTTAHSPDLIILDLMMPGIDGLDVCKKLKNSSETESIPIIMLTAKSTESDIVIGLELGADDYVVKPFSPRVLIARVKNILRRNDESCDSAEIIKCSGFIMDVTGRELKYKGRIIELTYSEFEIFKLLISRPGRVFSRMQIMKASRSDDYIVTERAMDVQIVNLRKKLQEGGECIRTIRSVGYKFTASSA